MTRLVLCYALAWAGGTIGYTPLLTILLPVQVVSLAGKSAGVHWLAYVALAGAVAASLGGILFGYLSDLTRNRRGWIAAGLILSCILLVATQLATDLASLVLAIVAWQLALNMMLGPLAALAAEVVPDRQKGLLGGLMAFAPGMGAAAGALVTLPGLASSAEMRLWMVAALVAACLLPILLLTLPQRHDATTPELATPAVPVQESGVRVMRMWLARLSTQVAEATLFAYLHYWLMGVDGSVSDNQTASLLTVIMLCSAPVALLAGIWSDHHNRPILPLRACALASSCGLLAMAAAGDLVSAMLAYGLFGVSTTVFLSLHSAQTLRVLPHPDRLGRDLGFFNLANTVPSLIMPWLALGLVPDFGFGGLFLLLALLTLLTLVLLPDFRS